ncbi:transcription factor IIIB 50 kDa subunit [Danio rerio]|uniref:transcription factor IIIB 50 kDa subunit n=1 Tax=Danio rerio TaxID=7955 RepID=UPI00003E26DA|nr:transcription factor IIIB 50 kDa subunit [Danio rerio]AAH78247.1 Zgc:100856 [Danio rerio]|eukprot:NP_001003536.1 transcription factor IIIB 50 kDa subunit [Danio rerio]
MSKNCPECGSSRVVEDDLYSQKQWVCEDCGSVVSEGLLTTTLSEESHSRAVPFFTSTAAFKKPCRNLVSGFSRLRALCRIFRLSSSMEDASANLFERAYNHPNFLHISLSKKQILAGCCMFHICRQNSWPVFMGTIGYLLDADNYQMGTIYQELTKSLNLQTTQVCITRMLESFCYDFKLAPDEVEEVFSVAQQRLVDQTSALLELAADTWILTGRRPFPLFLAAVYVAWQSLNPLARMKYSLMKFCKIAKAPEQLWCKSKDTINKRLNELLEVLCKLGRELPWVRPTDIQMNTVTTLVEDILKHRKALLIMAVKHYEKQLEETQTSQYSESELSDSKSSVQTQCKSPPDEEDEGCELPPDHWGKRHLFLPPCVRTQKRQKINEAPLEVTGDEDISDSEIESYIRSEEEIKLFAKARKKICKY